MAAETGDAGLQAHAIVLGLWIRLSTNPEGWAAEAEREARRAIATFGRLADERGLARAWSLLGLVQMVEGAVRARGGVVVQSRRARPSSRVPPRGA